MCRITAAIKIWSGKCTFGRYRTLNADNPEHTGRLGQLIIRMLGNPEVNIDELAKRRLTVRV